MVRSRLWVGLALLAIGGCRSADEETGPLIGVSLLNKQDVFYQDLEAGMEEAAAAGGARLLVQSAEKDLAAQTAQIENFVVRGVDAIIACPVDSRAVARALQGAAEAGVAVFTADIAADGVEVVAHIASDNVQGGHLAGEHLALLLGGEGAVAVVDHPEVTSVQDRVAGFLESVETHPGMELAARPSAQGRRDLALDVTTGLLQAHPEIRGIFAINDETALGVLAALASLGRDDVAVIGYDAIPEARRAIREGTPLRADVVQHPDEMGRMAVRAVLMHLRGEPVERNQPVPVSLVTREDLQAGDR